MTAASAGARQGRRAPGLERDAFPEPIPLGRLPSVALRCCRVLGAALGFLVGCVIGVRRQHVLSSLRRAGIAAPERVARYMYAGLGTSLFELLLTMLLPPRPRTRSALPEGAMVVATAHLGNWDYCACSAAAGRPLSVVTKHLSVGPLDVLWQWLRRRHGVTLVSEGRVYRHAQRALRQHGALAMMIDQAPERRRATVVTPFLGAPARVDLAPALIAMRARVPLVVAFPQRASDGSHCLVVAARFAPPERANRGWAEDVMRAATALLDAQVREHPEQWLWMHRRWKDSSPAGLLPRAQTSAC
ncbi:MAG: lysophospholipid acyltransferase family protein [Polyangiaceae bacterium]